MKNEDIAFIGILCLLFMAVSHTSMVIYDSLNATSLAAYTAIRVIIAVVVAIAMEGAIAFYLRNGYMAEAGINSFFTAVVYVCCVKPYDLDDKTYLGIAETVFGLSLGLNMYLYGRISAQQRQKQEKENAEITAKQQQITLLEKAKTDAEQRLNELQTALQQSQAGLEKAKTDAEQRLNELQTALQQLQTRLEHSETATEQAKTEAEQVKTDFAALQNATKCSCGYQADLKHHQAKCTHKSNLVEP